MVITPFGLKTCILCEVVKEVPGDGVVVTPIWEPFIYEVSAGETPLYTSSTILVVLTGKLYEK